MIVNSYPLNSEVNAMLHYEDIIYIVGKDVLTISWWIQQITKILRRKEKRAIIIPTDVTRNEEKIKKEVIRQLQLNYLNEKSRWLDIFEELRYKQKKIELIIIFEDIFVNEEWKKIIKKIKEVIEILNDDAIKIKILIPTTQDKKIREKTQPEIKIDLPLTTQIVKTYVDEHIKQKKTTNMYTDAALKYIISRTIQQGTLKITKKLMERGEYFAIKTRRIITREMIKELQQIQDT